MSNSVGRGKRDSHSIMAKLKAKTWKYHAKLESLPYFNQLIEHKLPMECYVNQLRALSIVHGVLENEIASVDDPKVSLVWKDDLRKLSLLEKDLSFFKPRVIADADSPIQAALAMTERIRLRKIENPITLLGYLYVFEGSTLGNSMHQPDISATFHLKGLNGCLYYSSYQDQVRAHWTQFFDKMNHALQDPSVHDPIIEAAHEAFAGLEVLYKALYPLEKRPSKYHVARINPEAGNHPIPEDEREIGAALKASDLGWAEFGYYEQRYGERGKRFSDSDSCWLVTLTELDQENLHLQIDWLCRVLAMRGMPTLMMEQTLEFLYDQLVEAVPEKGAVFAKLQIAADRLKKSRESRIKESLFQSLVEEFDQSSGDQLAGTFRNTGRLLISAVADEKNGIEGTVDALQEWLTDTNRFSTEWIHAVKKTIGKARNRASG